MARTPSNMLPLGTILPKFSLVDAISGNEFASKDLVGSRGLFVMFICNHCPFVIHVEEELLRISREMLAKDIGVVAISSNDIVQYPQDGPEEMAKKDYPFPYLFDKEQNVAKLFDAACTPDLFLFDESSKLVYRGQLDDSRPGNNVPVTGNDLRRAVDCLVSKKPLDFEQIPSLGCNIKWKNPT